MNKVTKNQIQNSLSDKDIQLIRKTYCKLTQIYYQQQDKQSIQDLIMCAQLITQIISLPKQAQSLSLLSIIQILKLKSKSKPQLISNIQMTIAHLKNPTKKIINNSNLIYGVQRNQLYSMTCTIAVRYYDSYDAFSPNIDWKTILQEISKNISINPILSIQLAFQICRQNQSNCKLSVKSGLTNYIFMTYIKNTLQNKLNLYKSIKLLKVIAQSQRTLIRQKQKGLATVIYTYQDYVPVIEQIVNKCYDFQYCSSIDVKRTYNNNHIDQLYLWSYLQQFVSNNISQQTILDLTKIMQKPQDQQKQTKIYSIMGNISKYKKYLFKNSLSNIPQSQKSLLNFIKLCVNSCQIDNNVYNNIKVNKIQQLVDKSTNPKVSQLFKIFKEMKNKQLKIGTLSDSVKKVYQVDKNADIMMQRACKIPQNNNQLLDIKQILKQKDRGNQFESDTLKTIKFKALQSLHRAIVQKKKLDLNIILKQIDLGDVKILARFLQILQLILAMHEDLIQTINTNRVFQIINWIQDNYKGQIIEWSSIAQVIQFLSSEQDWKKQQQNLTTKSFWILSIPFETLNNKKWIDNFLSKIENNLQKIENKIPFIIGYLGYNMNYQNKKYILSKYKQIFNVILLNIKNNNNYKSNLIMFALFIRKFNLQNQQNKQIKQLILSLINQLNKRLKNIQQQYQFLQNSLPIYQYNNTLSENIDNMLNSYGKLASQTYIRNKDNYNISYDKIQALQRLPIQNTRNIISLLNFLQKNSEILQQNLLQKLIYRLNKKKNMYWWVYPNFYNIICAILKVYSSTQNKILISNVSNSLGNIIKLVIQCEDASPEQKQDIFKQLKITIQQLMSKKYFLNKQLLLSQVEKIQNQQLKQQIVKLLKFYVCDKQQEKKISQTPKKQLIQQKNQKQQKVNNYIPSQQSNQKTEKSSFMPQSSNKFQILQRQSKNLSQQQNIILNALKRLKKIVDKQLPQDNFYQIHKIMLENNLKIQYMDILGHLLVKFYPDRPKQMQKMSLNLLLAKTKTRMSKQECYQLLSKHIQTFVLSQRWRLQGKQWLDLSMIRIQQNFLSDASHVAEYNLTKSSENEYFFNKNYHQIIVNQFNKISNKQQFINISLLIGTSARHPQIKNIYCKSNLHVKILQGIKKYQQDPKLTINISYSLSALVHLQPHICIDLVKYKQEIQQILKCLVKQSGTKGIIESGACLIANLAYSNDQIKQILRQLKTSQVFIQLFNRTLKEPDISTFRQILRTFGNLSLSCKFTQELIDFNFPYLAIQMTQILNVLINFDQKKALLLKTLIDLFSNLTSHKYKLQVFHKSKVTLFIMTLLQTIEQNPAITSSCIDNIDCLCQNAQIQAYVVKQKRLPYVLIDILKVQSDQKLVTKATRLLTNLTINQSIIPHILEANLLSVLANIVMPNFFTNKVNAEMNKKMQTYIQKILIRIYHSKPSNQLLIKSGYLDCLIKVIMEGNVVDDAYIQILYLYSSVLPSFLNKRAFLSVIRILMKKADQKQGIHKCIRTIKNINFTYQKDEQDYVFQGISNMYQKLLISQFKEDILFLLFTHLIRSMKLRQLLKKRIDRVVELIIKISSQIKLNQICRTILFTIYNNTQLFAHQEIQNNYSSQIAFQILKKGLKCNLFRADGTYKKAVIDVDENYHIRAYKYPDGQIKKKYIIDIKFIKDYHFDIKQGSQLWAASLFSFQKGIFQKKTYPACCCTLIGSSLWGQISYINVEFETYQQKTKFTQCLLSLMNSLR